MLTPTGSGTDTTPTFTWEAIADSSRYILHVQNRTTAAVEIRENSLTSNSFTIAGVTKESTSPGNDVMLASVTQLLEIGPTTTPPVASRQDSAQSRAQHRITEPVVDVETTTQTNTVLSAVVPQTAVLPQDLLSALWQRPLIQNLLLVNEETPVTTDEA